ncbi:MAG: dihydroxy-acid dehydratase, partial [Ruminococcus sp.]|nr:dihydroxy-acid dehydratase [Ruminococcus sp.]
MSDNFFCEGADKAPQRSLFNALGMTKEEMKRPLVGIVSSYNEIVPGHMNIDKLVEAVKLGVAMGGGTPVVFPAIAVCDGIAMGHTGMKYSLVTRDLIADSTECMALAHHFDALVMIPNCDKNVPGLLMAAARINVPTVFVSGGPMLAGHVKGKKTSLSSMFEAVGAYSAGKIDEAELDEFENKTCPTCGSCSGMYTANSMNCLTEVLGMGLKGNGTIPAVYSERIKLAKQAGMQVMELYRQNIRPLDIMTEKAFRNALTADMALGCSTNSMLHLPAIANECGININLDMANEISAKTPNLCHLAPAGHTYMEDLNEAGGVYAVLNELSKKGLINTDCMTVTGKTVGENIKGCINRDPETIRPIDNPYSETGGIAVLKGNLAPDEWADPDPHDLAFIYYTSGSTGLPKGVAQEYGVYRYIMSSTDRAIGRWIPLDYANVAPETFIGGLYLMMGVLQAGSTLHLIPLTLVRDPIGLLDYFKKQNVTASCMPPTLVKALESAGGIDVKVLHITGEIATDLYIDRFPVLNAYGPTEFS